MIKLGSSKIFIGESALNDGIKSIEGERNKVFIVMNGDILEKVGLLSLLTDTLEENNIEWEMYNKVEEEPSFETILDGVKELNKFSPNWIIGFGGGSAMDAAKAMWVYYENEEYSTLKDAAAPNIIEKLGKKAKICCIPTTAGTGSEVTRASLIKDCKEKKKYAIVDFNGRLNPEIAILDERFTETMPDSVTVSSGMDALTHAIESYVNPNGNPFSKTLALGSYLYAMENLPYILTDNTSARRSDMLASSAMGGIAFSNSGLGIVHGIAHSYGAEFNIPHGLANAVVLPYGLKYNMKDESINQEFKKLVSYIGKESLLDEIISLRETLDIPETMSEIITNQDEFESKLDLLVENAMSDVTTKVNPVEINQESMKQLIRESYYGFKE